MPGLTVDTSPSLHRHPTPHTPSQTPSTLPASHTCPPTPPPVSPITPTLGAARLASSNSPNTRTYTHSQAPQTRIPQPPPIPLTLEENPDALALKSAISILQIQARNATADIRTLQAVKERALQDPEAFGRALREGVVGSKKGDALFDPGRDSEDDDEDDEADTDGKIRDVDVDMNVKGEEKWPKLPTPQNIVRAPPINWTQYAVVGDSLDKLHADQQARPSEGMPQRYAADGSLTYGGEGTRRVADMGVAAPYQLGRDKIEKMSTRKGGKR